MRLAFCVSWVLAQSASCSEWAIHVENMAILLTLFRLSVHGAKPTLPCKDVPMRELPIEANICERDGAYYPVLLRTVPRVGELIDLWSLIDQAAKHPPVKHYEVFQVVHEIHDVSKEIRASKGGYHNHMRRAFLQTRT